METGADERNADMSEAHGSISVRLTTFLPTTFGILPHRKSLRRFAGVADGCVSSSRSTPRRRVSSGSQRAYTRSVIAESLCANCRLTYLTGSPHANQQRAEGVTHLMRAETMQSGLVEDLVERLPHLGFVGRRAGGGGERPGGPRLRLLQPHGALVPPPQAQRGSELPRHVDAPALVVLGCGTSKQVNFVTNWMNRGEAAVAAVMRPKSVPRCVSILRFKGRVGAAT